EGSVKGFHDTCPPCQDVVSSPSSVLLTGSCFVSSMTGWSARTRTKVFVKRAVVMIAAAIAAVTLAYAQGYPSKVVKIVSPFAPGGPGDLLPRAVAAGLAPLLGQPVIVENRPGATTVIAMQAVAKSPPDGYTLVFTSMSSFISVSAY